MQYRIAALAGVATQFAWAGMIILAFSAFYRTDPNAFPMTFSQTTTYIWLQQALMLLIFMAMSDTEIISAIRDGSIAYEMVRPIDIYNRWICQIIAQRLAGVSLRALPMFIVSALLPYPYGISLPVNGLHFLLFIVSLVTAALLVAAILNLAYVALFYTNSHMGIQTIIWGSATFLSGMTIPIPFFPEPIRSIAQVLPFAALQDLPLRIYSGHIYGVELVQRMGLQIFWLLFMLGLGRLLIKRALRRVFVQGG